MAGRSTAASARPLPRHTGTQQGKAKIGAIMSLAWACACRKPRPRSCDQAIFVDQATGASVSSDAVLLKIDRVGQRLQWRGAVQAAVRPGLGMVALGGAPGPPQ